MQRKTRIATAVLTVALGLGTAGAASAHSPAPSTAGHRAKLTVTCKDVSANDKAKFQAAFVRDLARRLGISTHRAAALLEKLDRVSGRGGSSAAIAKVAHAYGLSPQRLEAALRSAKGGVTAGEAKSGVSQKGDGSDKKIIRKGVPGVGGKTLGKSGKAAYAFKGPKVLSNAKPGTKAHPGKGPGPGCIVKKG